MTATAWNIPSICFENMPPEVLIYGVLPYLNPLDLWQLKRVNRKFRDVVNAFIKTNKNLDMEEVTRICADNKEKIIATFEFMTGETRSLVRINLKNCGSWMDMSQLNMILERNKKLVEVNLSNVRIWPILITFLLKLPKLRIVKIGEVAAAFKPSAASKRMCMISETIQGINEDLDTLQRKVEYVHVEKHFPTVDEVLNTRVVTSFNIFYDYINSLY